MRTMIYFIAIFLSFISCISQGNKTRVYETDHFKIFYTKLDDRNIKQIADCLENSYPKIITQLQSDKLPTVNVHFYTDISDLQKAVKTSVPNLPAWAVGLATSVSEIHMISPNHPKQDYQTMIRNTIHEFAHCVSLNINKTIANNPRWLWEAVAIYEANLPWDPHQLSYLVNQKPPTIDELNQLSNTYIYEVGYFIAEYLVKAKGNSVLNTLIKNNGNLRLTLNADDEGFTKQWFTFIKEKYGI
jgi:hypothetical protein